MSKNTLSIATAALLLSTSLAFAQTSGASDGGNLGASSGNMGTTGSTAGAGNGSMGAGGSGAMHGTGMEASKPGVNNPKGTGSEPGMTSSAGTSK